MDLSKLSTSLKQGPKKLDEYITVKELAGMLKLSTCTIFRMIHDKRIPYLKIGARYRFSVQQISRWLEDGECLEIHPIVIPLPHKSNEKEPKNQGKRRKGRTNE